MSRIARMGVAGSNRHGDTNPPRSRDRSGSNRPNPRSGRMAFTISSEYAAGRDIQNRILDEVRRNGFRGDSFFAINLALEEALTNAIKHGNRLDPAKKIRIEARVTPRRAEIVVEDEGVGFARRDIPDPTAAENLEKCNGRGILLIEAYMDRVVWDRGGRRVRMIKLNEPQPT